ncbi:MAG: HAD family hydrolase [Lachnospiraceae bacterium]|nr:HAD family hydrolase [Lachnospiraceae bacterium]
MKHRNEMKKGIIFDMDGTLWDAAEEIAKSWGDSIRTSEITDKALTKEDMMKVMGKPMDELMAALFPELTDTDREKLLKECCQVENDYLREHGAKLYEGVEEMFSTLQKDYFLAIVSNCQSGYIEAFLEHYGFGKYIDDIQCFGMNQLPKGENIRLVVERNHLEKAVYVGDIQGDYEASMQAGVDFIHAAYGFGEIVEKVPRIQKLEELPQVVAELLK